MMNEMEQVMQGIGPDTGAKWTYLDADTDMLNA
jgi:hypothetical protein